jgi:predicted deacylase
MIDGVEEAPRRPREIRRTTWIRARRSGVASLAVDVGAIVEKGQEIARIGDVMGGRDQTLRAPGSGIVIGARHNPLVHRGEAIAHIGMI